MQWLHFFVIIIVIICLSYVMSETGVTQQQIDEMRLKAENTMLSDMQNILNGGGNIEFHGQSGETPVTKQ